MSVSTQVEKLAVTGAVDADGAARLWFTPNLWLE
jgi:hypothetical protein